MDAMGANTVTSVLNIGFKAHLTKIREKKLLSLCDVKFEDFKALENKINIQRELIQKGNPVIELINPCRVDNGILQISDQERQQWAETFADESRDISSAFFVPASGSGSRMFGAIFDFLNSSNPSEESIEFIEHLLNSIEDFAFYNRLPQPVKDDLIKGSIEVNAFLKLLLFEEGFNYGKLPKGLIPFHRYGKFIVNPFQEHILQGTQISGERSTFHFTIQQEFEDKIRQSIKILRDITGIDFSFHFSVQDPETDSVAFKSNGSPHRSAEGEVITRPAGHGALLKNLNEIDADLIFIRNIDNIQHQDSSDISIETRKALAGMLMEFRSRSFAILSKITLNEDYRSAALELNKEFDLQIPEQVFDDKSQLANWFSRPIRICGMVKNEGQHGGGPFWVKDQHGMISRQIVEKSQISNAPDQLGMVIKSTHFNPVEIICSVKDASGKKYDLSAFANENLYFIVDKQHEGDDIRFLEQPGLWNGGMAEWITLFVEIENDCFSPVKTVLDLLKPLHREPDQHLH